MEFKTHELTASDEDLVRAVFISELGGIAFPGFLDRNVSRAAAGIGTNSSPYVHGIPWTVIDSQI